MVENETVSEEQQQQDSLRKELESYDGLVLQAYDLLNETNRPSLVHALKHCGITDQVKVNRIYSDNDWEALTRQGRQLYMIVSNGNLFLAQDAWNQNTGRIANDNTIYNDAAAKCHLMLAFDIAVPHAVLRILFLNARKQIPVLTTLYGYEPYNIIDLSEEEYQKQKAAADATALVYQERYKGHIEMLLKQSPYQAANAILVLQANLNLAVQHCIHEILSRGNLLTVDMIVHYSFEPLADATRELLTKYHSLDATEEDKRKVIRYIALYFETMEQARNKAIDYIQSLNDKFGIEDTEAVIEKV